MLDPDVKGSPSLTAKGNRKVLWYRVWSDSVVGANLIQILKNWADRPWYMSLDDLVAIKKIFHPREELRDASTASRRKAYSILFERCELA